MVLRNQVFLPITAGKPQKTTRNHVVFCQNASKTSDSGQMYFKTAPETQFWTWAWDRTLNFYIPLFPEPLLLKNVKIMGY